MTKRDNDYIGVVEIKDHPYAGVYHVTRRWGRDDQILTDYGARDLDFAAMTAKEHGLEVRHLDDPDAVAAERGQRPHYDNEGYEIHDA